MTVHKEEIYERIQAEKYGYSADCNSASISTKSFNDSILSDEERQTGTISHLNGRGYGFIYLTGCADRIHFHAKSLLGVEFSDLDDGLDVEFFQPEGNEGLVDTDISLSNVKKRM